MEKELEKRVIERLPLQHIQDLEQVNLGLKEMVYKLVDKAAPREVEQEFGYYDMTCPNENCNHKIDKRYQNNCGHCGQTLKWSDDE